MVPPDLSSKTMLIPQHWLMSPGAYHWVLKSPFAAWDSKLSSCLVCLKLRHAVLGNLLVNSHFKRAPTIYRVTRHWAAKKNKASPWKQGAHKPFGTIVLCGDNIF